MSPSRSELGSNSDDDDDGNSRLFSAVLSSVNMDRLACFCFRLRTKSENSTCDHPAPSALPRVDEPLYGSFHALLPIQFHDGLKWLMKIPANGTQDLFDESASKALTAEALTMIYIRLNTSIPIPKVLTYNASLENELGCPFIIITFVDGISLYDCWFDKSGAHNDHFRANALKDIAAAMAQLDRFSFDSGGSLLFDDIGEPNAVGPMRCVDRKAMLDQMFSANEDETIRYFDAGPFSEIAPFYTHLLDRDVESQSPTQEGLKMLLRLFISWVPDCKSVEKTFVLTHPDFDIQNFIVSQDGHLQAIIDWDGIAAVPRSVGFESYPGWLTRDWDPAMYGWTEDMERGIEPRGVWEDSPTTLARHRAEYVEYMRLALSQERKKSSSTAAGGSEELPDTSWTVNSLYIENLLIASGDPPCRYEILKKFMDAINEELDRKGCKEVDILDVVEMLGDGKLDQAMEADLKWSFQALFQ